MFDNLGDNFQRLRMCVDKVHKIPDDNRIEIPILFLRLSIIYITVKGFI